MYKHDVNITSELEAHAFVQLCEDKFEKELTLFADGLTDDKSCRIITLSGPTCSGKTTAAKKITAAAEKKGLRTRVISIDDFYLTPDLSDPNPDYESVSAIDLELFAVCANALIKGNTAYLPTFDFKVRDRVALTEYVPCENDIYIFEGIQALYPEIRALLPENGYASAMIGVFDDVCVNGVSVGRNYVRLARRLIRDFRFRSTDFETTMKLWKTVRENEDKNIYPYVDDVRHKISSYLPYELPYIGNELLPMLYAQSAIKDGKLTELIERLKAVINPLFKNEMIPLNSLFREFIG